MIVSAPRESTPAESTNAHRPTRLTRVARLLLGAWASAVCLQAHPAEGQSPPTYATADTVPQDPNSSSGPVTGLIYDHDYPFIDYSGTPRHNDVERLLARIKSGKAKLTYVEPRGYLDSLLKALGIDPDSQVMVFSKTSLQADLISPQTPRAIYFNDDTYVAWIEHTPTIEINTMDSLMGTVFYTLADQPAAAVHFERQTTRCLSCHDTFSLSGGGVPNFLILSAYTRKGHEIVTNDVAEHTYDDTPLTDRWGGWYVTGTTGDVPHLGNILPAPAGTVPVSAVHPHDLSNLDGLLDTTVYPTNTSDVVALLVLQHQVDIHNLIIHANYRCRWLLERFRHGSSTANLTWQQLPADLQRHFVELLEPLVRGMLMVGAAPLPHPIRGSSGFAKSFQARGPRDSQGRSLRDLNLKTRLFRYPLSFLVYSEGFDYLPSAAKQYVYRRLDAILTGRDASPTFSSLSASDRAAILEILSATKPDFARTVAQRRGSAAGSRIHSPDAAGR
jgi:hypothetical protein